MPRSVVYVGGAGRHLLNQSADVIADRVARSIQAYLHRHHGRGDYTWRVFLKPDAHQLAPGIKLDIASVKILKNNAWLTVLEFHEVKYVDEYLRRFRDLPPLGRAARALRAVGQFVKRKSCEQHRSPPVPTDAERDDATRKSKTVSRSKTKARSTPEIQRCAEGSSTLDKWQARSLFFLTTAAIGSVVYWLCVGAIALIGLPALFGDPVAQFWGITERPPTPVGLTEQTIDWRHGVVIGVLGLAAALRRPLLADLEEDAVDFFTGIEYQADGRPFGTITSSILDAIIFGETRTPGKVDLLTFSLGTLLAADAIFPPGDRKHAWSPSATAGTWITAGFPYDILRSGLPTYFDNRQPPTVRFDRWMNLVVKYDLLGTHFGASDGRGIRVGLSDTVHAPSHRPEPFSPPRKRPVKPRFSDVVFPRRRLVYHRLYWDDEDPRASTCFDQVVEEPDVGWAADMLDALRDGATMYEGGSDDRP